MIKDVRNIAKKKGYLISYLPNKLNIWGFRSPNAKPNSFDDQIHVFFNTSAPEKPVWKYYVFPCTTDPGLYWLTNPTSKSGTAILKAGQYLNTYAVAKHQGKYLALCQRLGKVTVKRDTDQDTSLDFDTTKTATGWFGINIHHASKVGSTLLINKYSAGCQVFKNIVDFNFFMKLCGMHRLLYSNSFSYTLIDLKEESKTSADYSKSNALSAAPQSVYAPNGAMIWDDLEQKQWVSPDTYLGIFISSSNGVTAFLNQQNQKRFIATSKTKIA